MVVKDKVLQHHYSTLLSPSQVLFSACESVADWWRANKVHIYVYGAAADCAVIAQFAWLFSVERHICAGSWLLALGAWRVAGKRHFRWQHYDFNLCSATSACSV